MIIQNRTHYFGEYTKLYNAVPDPDSFSFESSKRMGYFQRLFFEYAYTRKVRGKCFYYTLTYNDFHIPQYYGKPCFSYEHIRYITNGKLSKVLMREYGSRLRYFCACESGEGKGKRGLGNNPHYHFIFFVQPIHDKDGQPLYDTYKQIPTESFKELIYDLWQGQSSKGWHNWLFAKFGHCQEGKFNGEVLSVEAFFYVGKYCIKDAAEKNREYDLEKIYFKECIDADINNDVLYQYYKYLKGTDLSITNKYDFFERMYLFDYSRWRKSTGCIDKSYERYLFDYCGSLGQIISFNLQNYWHDVFIPQYIESRKSEYRNLYSPKCRMSKSLGEYGTNFVMLVDGSPRIVLNTKSGYKVQYPCLYYIRKLFYDVKLCPVTGNPLYYLNERGRQMKLDSVSQNIKNFAALVHENISYVQHNMISISKSESDFDFNNLLDCCVDRSILPKDYYDDTKYQFKIEYPVLTEFMSLSNKDEIIRRYSVYHYIYQYRNYCDVFGLQLDDSCSESAYLHDYSVFLTFSSYFLDYEEGSICRMVVKSVSTMHSFRNFPCFAPYLNYFDYLDELMLQVSQVRSDNAKRLFADSSEHQKRMKASLFNQGIVTDAQLPFVL